jgi:hypothetical protein
MLQLNQINIVFLCILKYFTKYLNGETIYSSNKISEPSLDYDS